MDDNPAKLIPSDGELLDAVQKGSEERTEELVHRWNSTLSKLITTYLAAKGCSYPDEHADGTITNTWLTVFHSIKTLRDVSNFGAWLSAIARRKAIEHLRECLREQNTSLDLEGKPIVSADKLIENVKLAKEIIELAERISPRFAQIISLRFVEGFSFNEIADQLGEDEAALRTIYSRGLFKLRRKLSRPEAVTAKLPVEELSDEEVLALTELRLTDEQQTALDNLLSRHQEGTLDTEGQRRLNELMRLYEQGLLRKAQALRVAVQRELIEPLQP